jgi:hypothetical protein
MRLQLTSTPVPDSKPATPRAAITGQSLMDVAGLSLRQVASTPAVVYARVLWPGSDCDDLALLGGLCRVPISQNAFP